ncbi:MAG: tetratricopeptide repeat protein [Phycisphaerae bacterium]
MAGILAYANSFAGVFLFDDRLHILGERRIKVLWPLWEALRRKRPVVDYSLALNYALFADRPFGYHAVNLIIHLLAALTLMGIVRRTLIGACFRGRFARLAPWVALAVALLWVVHPLQTQSVTYVVQRAESLMGLFYLLTLYCTIRAAASQERHAGRRAIGWVVAAVVSCAMGMGSKGVMVTAPILVLLYDRIFLSPSMIGLVRRRAGLYLPLLATWSVFWLNGLARGVMSTSNRRANVGFGFKGLSPLDYARTQCGVLVEYLKLSVWPHPLCLDYVWPAARTAAEWAVPGLIVLGLLGVTIGALIRRPPIGFVGACFFIILAPTSSIVPIKDPLFEHRMYLPLAAVLVVLVIGAVELIRRAAAARRRSTVLCVAGLLCAATVLGFATSRRNATYASEAGMWRDVRFRRPNSTRAAENYGTALLAEGRLDEALAALQDAVRISPRSADARNGLGFALVAQGRLQDAIVQFQEAIRLRPTFARAYLNLGNALSDTGQPEAAMDMFEAALRTVPTYSEARLNLGNAFLARGDTDRAIEQYRAILEFDPQNASAHANLGFALLQLQRVDEAIASFRRAMQIDPQAHNPFNGLGIALIAQGRREEAIEAFRAAVRVKPDFGGAHHNLARTLGETGDLQGAERHYRTALRSQPRNVSTRFELAGVLRRLGREQEATEEYQRVLSLDPNHAGARRAIRKNTSKADR